MMPVPSRWAAAPLLALFLTGCSLLGTDEEPGTPLTPDQIDFSFLLESVEAGDRAVLLLLNRSEEPIVYDLCGTALETLTPEGWQETEATRPVETVCTADLKVLAAGRAVQYAWGPFREALPPGDYRFATDVRGRSESMPLPIVTTEFRVPAR